MFLIPLLLIFFKEPLTAAIEKKTKKIEGGIGMFIVQGFFEMFEVLLSYFSNTLSFVRVGAFAVSHAAMMEVVLMLAGAEAGNPVDRNLFPVQRRPHHRLKRRYGCGAESPHHLRQYPASDQRS